MLTVFTEKEVTCIQYDVYIKDKKVNAVFCFYIDGMLVDAGAPNMLEKVIPFYKSHDIDLVVLTHSHEDHCGTALWLQENLLIPIYNHENGIEICAKDATQAEYRQIFWGKRQGFKALSLKDKDIIHSKNEAWEVIYTPGHADDHIALYNPKKRIMFTGDLYMTSQLKIILEGESIKKMKQSIRKILTYDFDEIYCCHAGFVANGKEALQEKLANLEDITGQVSELYKRGLTAEEIKEELFPENYSLIKTSKGEWDTLHIVTSIIEEELR